MATIRPENPADNAGIHQLVEAAFAPVEQSDHTEQHIVDALRVAGALTVSLVAEDNNTLVGHVAASPVTLGTSAEGAHGWYGIGPVAVAPQRQGEGIGSALMEASLDHLRQAGAAGAVVLGEPAYYNRFGFHPVPGLEYPGVPAKYFTACSFGPEIPLGEARYHPAFGESAH